MALKMDFCLFNIFLSTCIFNENNFKNIISQIKNYIVKIYIMRLNKDLKQKDVAVVVL